MAFLWQADDGPTLNASLVALWFFIFFGGGGVPVICPPTLDPRMQKNIMKWVSA